MTHTRRATLADVAPIRAMFEQFVSSTKYERYVGNDPEYSTGLIERLIASSDDAAIFVADCDGQVVGMFAVFVFQHPMSGRRVATEAFWWLDPAHRGYGVYLLRKAERWARERGAWCLSMMAPSDKPRVAQIYEALGYERVEITYQKALL